MCQWEAGKDFFIIGKSSSCFIRSDLKAERTTMLREGVIFQPETL